MRRPIRQPSLSEKRAADPSGSFCAWVSSPRRFPYHWHHHEEWELVLIRGGAGVRMVADVMERFRVGEVVLIPPRVPHCWSSDAEDTAANAIVVQFPAALTTWIAARPEFTAVSAWLRQVESGFAIAPRSISPVLAASLATIVIQPTPSPRRMLLLLDMLLQLAASSAPIRQVDAHVVSTAIPAALKPAFDLIDQRWHQAPRQAEAARRCGLTPSAFAKRFRHQTARTWGACLAERRVREACARLRTSREPVAAIALACGFHSLAAFNRRFRSITGLTPTGYVRNLAP